MTCGQVLELLDTLLMEGASPPRLRDAERHLRQCLSCRTEWHAANDLRDRLRTMPLPPPPPDLETAILARVARQPSPAAAPAAADSEPAFDRQEALWLGVSLTGVVVCLGALGAGLLRGGIPWLRLSPLVDTSPAIQRLAAGAPLAYGALATGLAWYAASLIGSLWTSSARRRSGGCR